MEKEKVIGEYCKFTKQYVPVTYRYYDDGRREQLCGKSACGNTNCALSEAFHGDRSEGQDYLEK